MSPFFCKWRRSTSFVLWCFLLFSFFVLGNCRENSTAAGKISRKSFPQGFVFGTATAAYQVEGAVKQDGRGKSIWDIFSHKLGNILDLSNGDIAVDEYNRYQEDVRLMANMTVDAYRFSISWPRIFPSANGSINNVSINHYNDLINALVSKGIQPYVTLYHWDLPQALQDKYGGWLHSAIIDDYLIYVKTCFEAFGDRVKHWITFNEPYSFISQGFSGFGTQAPGRCSLQFKCDGGNSSTEPYIVAHNVLLAHASAVALYKEKYQSIEMETVLVLRVVVPHGCMLFHGVLKSFLIIFEYITTTLQLLSQRMVMRISMIPCFH